MGNKTIKYENDPYLNNQQYNQAISSFYNQQSLIPSEQLKNEDVSKLKENQKHTVTKSLQNYFIIKKGSIKFEKDCVNSSKYYISFEYISYSIVSIQILFNASILVNEQTVDCDFLTKKILIEKSAPEYKVLLNEELSITSEQIQSILHHKDKGKNDLLIKVDYEDTSILLLFDFKWINGNPSLKFRSHKIKTESGWYDVHDVYGLSSEDTDEALCKICCVNNKNTILIPCMHSYTCDDCTIQLRMKDPKCPICRQAISDSVVLDKIS